MVKKKGEGKDKISLYSSLNYEIGKIEVEKIEQSVKHVRTWI